MLHHQWKVQHRTMDILPIMKTEDISDMRLTHISLMAQIIAQEVLFLVSFRMQTCHHIIESELMQSLVEANQVSSSEDNSAMMEARHGTMQAAHKMSGIMSISQTSILIEMISLTNIFLIIQPQNQTGEMSILEEVQRKSSDSEHILNKHQHQAQEQSILTHTQNMPTLSQILNTIFLNTISLELYLMQKYCERSMQESAQE